MKRPCFPWWSLVFALLAATAVLGQEGTTWQRSSRYVAVRDGTRLALNLYRPLKDGQLVTAPQPVIFLFTPYRARYRRPDGSVAELDQVKRLGLERLFAAGYVVAEADIRGKGASFGARRGFQDRTEAQDGHDLVQWLASQPFANGVVGMVGCSYLGGTTVHVASTRPPALKAIFTGATDLDKFAFVRAGGITAQFNTRPDEPLSDDLASLPMDEDGDGSLLRAAVAEHAANTPMAALWYGMPYRDSVSPLTGTAFWEEVGPYSYLEDLRASGIASYFWGNLRDEPTSQVIQAAANLDSRLLIGPGSHCVPPPDYDLGGEIQRFFDFHLKGIDNGWQHEPRSTVWVEEAPTGQQWRRSDTLPGAASRPQVWYLGAEEGGTLQQQAAPAGSRQFSVDYAVGEGEYFAFWVESQAAHGLTFTSPALTQPLTLEGYPQVHLRVAADHPEVHVFAYLEEIDAEGSVDVLATGRLAASYRATAEAPYDTLGLPWYPSRAADSQPLQPGEPVDLALALLPVSHIVQAGHRLRLTVTGADPRQRNLAELRQDPAPVITLLTGGDAARLTLPLRD